MLRREVPPEGTAAYAREVERLGFDELWLVEDCFFAAGVAPAAVALAATSTLTVGIGVQPAVMRNAATAAMELSALTRMFPGRVLPGFGHGVADWMRQIGAFPSSQLAALGETTSAVRALLRGERVDVAGKHVHLDGVQLEFPPAQVPPISLGVRGPKSLALSGRVADGTVLTEWSTPAYVRQARERIDAGRAEVGRTDEHRLTIYAYWAADPDALRPVAAGLMSAELDGQLAVAGLRDDVVALRSRFPEPDAFAAAVPEEWFHALTACGEHAASYVESLYDAGAASVVLMPMAEDPATALHQLADARRELNRA